MKSPRTVGIVGAGRTRVGLGPYFARDCERAGLRLAGIAGRDPARTAALAARYAEQFGHPVAAHTDPLALARSVDALVVATPAEHHADGLAAALAAQVPCLCEKPLVAPHQFGRGRELALGFAARSLLLVENCQWPFVLPAFDRLFPGARRAVPRCVAMGLSPSQPGAEMVLDSLSHVLSFAQAVLPADAGLRLLDCALEDPRCAGDRNVLGARLAWTGGELALELQLQVCTAQPRPAWLSIDGRRMDRRIGADYAIAFAAGERVLAADDPLTQSVAAFAERLRAGAAAAVAAEGRRVLERLELYAAIVQRLGLAGG
jgi:predicted dehydrogenase